MMKIVIVLFVMLIGPAHGQLAAQSTTTTPLQHQFTYSIVESDSDLTALVADIKNLVVTSTLLADAKPFALWSPVDKPDDAPFVGLNSNQVILMLAWDRPAADLVSSLETVLRSLSGVSDVSTRLYTPLYLTDGLNVPTDSGFYVHRDEFYMAENVDDAFRLSREAWVTFEPAFGVKVVGLFREIPQRDGVARLNRIFWYPDFAGWQNSRNFEIDPESQRRFQERRQYQVEGSGIAFATDRVPLP
jgi:hypothetical protein